MSPLPESAVPFTNIPTLVLPRQSTRQGPSWNKNKLIVFRLVTKWTAWKRMTSVDVAEIPRNIHVFVLREFRNHVFFCFPLWPSLTILEYTKRCRSTTSSRLNTHTSTYEVVGRKAVTIHRHGIGMWREHPHLWSRSYATGMTKRSHRSAMPSNLNCINVNLSWSML